MVDRRRIVDLWKQGAATVLVTLVRTEGSSYRRPGAHLLIAGNGAEYAGTISGGCLETEVVRKAGWFVESGPTVKRYSTLFDDTAEIPFGLGCGGVVDLLFEPAGTPEFNALLLAMEASFNGSEFSVVTWLPENGGPFARAIFNAAGELTFASERLTSADIDAAHSGTTANLGIYVEHLAGPQRLFVLGAGDDAKPVVTMASLLGWRVFVADGRSQLAKSGRFPEAERVLTVSSSSELSLHARDAVILMTHSYEQDRALLAGLLSSEEIPGYIGLLGASHRSALLVSEAAAMIGTTVAVCCQRVWAPVGLNLGGDGAEAIALAVIAEVHAWREGKLAATRRLTPERVAEQIAKSGASRYMRTQCAVGAGE
jgi:xanthine/CO dehydrogenase XdhC/CoxF family maturation factor